MAVHAPEDKPIEVPAYMVSFGDMITLLLTFFILLVSMADTQAAGLVGAGRGPLVQHVNAKGEPGILKGHLQEHRQTFKRDSWWIPDQEGDPDQLEVVREKLRKEISVKFKPSEARLVYEQDKLAMRLPVHIEYDAKGRPQVGPELREILATVVTHAGRVPGRHIRINGDVKRSDDPATDWRESARICELVYTALAWQGMPSTRMSIWGWGSTRSIVGIDATDRGVTLEVIDTGEDTTEQDSRR